MRVMDDWTNPAWLCNLNLYLGIVMALDLMSIRNIFQNKSKFLMFT